MKVFTKASAVRRWSDGCRAKGAKIALVPTMGYLHEGHLSLIRRAKALKADEIIVSIFVNPVQFCPGEDFEKYPRDELSDTAKCRAAGATAVFIPPAGSMYAADHSVYVDETSLSAGLCGASRPGHFKGVCTVVAKLFNIVNPDIAVFGRKDFQQAAIVKRMARDLDFRVKIAVAPIVREKSGLAMSSRNSYLSDSEKARAAEISRALAMMKHGKGFTLAALHRHLEKSGLEVEYVTCVDSSSLRQVRRPSRGNVVLVAARCGRTRLIDNIVL